MKKYILAIAVAVAASLALAAGDAEIKSIRERVEEAALDISKIAELMPEKQDDRDEFQTELLYALASMPISPEEKSQKIAAAKKVFADLREKENAAELLVFPVASPEIFTGAVVLGLTSS